MPIINPQNANLRPNANQPENRSARHEDRLTRYANALVFGVARHWLAFFNAAWVIYIGLPFLAPLLMHWGYEGPALLIYKVYSFLCHQFPDHSYFLFGNNFVPSEAVLLAHGMPPGADPFQTRAFIGNAELGYKVAICERDVAIYGSILMAGLAFALLRQRTQAISIKRYALLILPMALDGLSQLVGLRESNWWLRSATGILFGVASVWLAYPYLQAGMDDVLVTGEQSRRVGHNSGVTT